MSVDGAKFGKALLASILIMLGAACTQTSAATLVFKCIENGKGEPKPEFTLTYEGSDRGRLTLKSASEEMVLPATKTTKDGKNDSGETYTVTGIRASGDTMALMPDKAAIEACVKGKLKPEQLTDEDIVFITALGCAAATPLGKEPVKINAFIEIAVIEPLSAQVFLTKTFVEPTSLPGGTLKIDSLPPPSCSPQ